MKTIPYYTAPGLGHAPPQAGPLPMQVFAALCLLNFDYLRAAGEAYRFGISVLTIAA
jgi:hypothetical protein